MMDTQRLVALFVFIFSGFLLWEAWQKQQLPPRAPASATRSQTNGTGAIPAPTASPQSGAPAAPSGAAQAPPAGAVQRGERVQVTTDRIVAEIDTIGGDLRRLVLSEHRAVAGEDKRLALFQDDGAPFYVAQTGLIGKDLPNHNTRYRAETNNVALGAGQESVSVRLVSEGDGPLQATKTYTFHRGSYLVDVAYALKNTSAGPIAPLAYFQFLRDGTPPPGDPRFISTFTGPAIYTEQKKFQKVAFADIDKGKQEYPTKSNDGWLAMVQHYFVAAWLPKNGGEREFFARKVDDKHYAAGVIVPVGEVAAGAQKTLTVSLYAGPQEGEKLGKIAPGLDLTIDYGWLTVIAYPLYWVLAQIHKVVGNWGVAIIVLTVLIKLIFFPLSAASYKSMARMKVLAPKLQKLKEQYGENREKMNQAMMELYKTEKVNPLGGCLPIAIQIPVFIALYWVLLASVELRHAPFFGWIKDLSTPDPWYVLPLIMGATMLWQTKLNPTPPDPVQAKVMMIMPIAFSIFFFFFPAGLVLYWTVNNVLSIAQQWQINRMAEKNAAAGKGNAKR
jgi:YidC/Oxa1 family membrane protein insertase